MTDGDQHDARTESITDLIVLGRDREAVAAATRTSNQGGPWTVSNSSTRSSP